MRLFRLAVFRRNVETDVDEELRFHLQSRVEELIQRGLTESAARARARAEFGDLAAARTELAGIGRRREGRAARLEGWRDVFRDARIALRSYAREPLFTAVVLLTLALGIGANTAIFGLVDAALLRPLPYRDPGRLVFLWETQRGDESQRTRTSYPGLLDWRAERWLFEGIEGFDGTNVTVSGSAGTEFVQGARISSGFFDLLGVVPAWGRAFTSADEVNPATAAVVLSHGFWIRRFGADPKVVGSTLLVDGTAHEIRGILPAHFSFAPAGEAELWLPLGNPGSRTDRRDRWLQPVGRLRDGVSLEQARARMATLMAGRAAEYPESNAGRGVLVLPLRDVVAAGVERPLLVLFGAVGIVLLIACANVATLILARSITRGREVAVRSALGASRARVVRQLLTENLLLALVGALLGAAVAAAGLRLLLLALPDSVFGSLPVLRTASLSLKSLAFTTLVALGIGLVCALAPAFLVSRRSAAELLRSDARVGGGRAQHRFRDALVTLEIALTLVLLVGAGLLGRSVLALLRLDPGFTAEGVATLRVALARPAYADEARQQRFFEDLLERVRVLPGVAAAGAVSSAPLQGGGTTTFRVEGEPEPQPGQLPEAMTRAVAGDYFAALRIAVPEGRALGPRDDLTAPRAVVINRTLARRLFGSQPALGRRIRFTRQDSAWTVVGVAGDVKTGRLDEPVVPTIYTSHLQGAANRMSLFVKTSGAAPEPLIPAIRREVQALDPSVAAYSAQSLVQLVERSPAVASRRYLLVLLGSFAAAALLLAMIGVYGVIAYSVAQRSREVAVRMALGATRARVLALVSRSGLRLLAGGLVLGGLAALALTRMLGSLLYAVGSADPVTYGAVASGLLVVVLLATWIPARRATRVHPALTLRGE